MTITDRTPADASVEQPGWDGIRALFPLPLGRIHLDTATIGSVPEPVLAELGVADREYARDPRDPYAETVVLQTRATLAAAYGCDPDELALVPSGIDGQARIIAGLDLGAGDEVLTTTHECFTVRAPLAQLRDRHGVVVRALTPPVGPDQTAEEIVELFAAAIGPRTRALVFAAVTLTTGTALPVRELTALAREHDLITVVDGGLLPGVAELDLHELGVDFLSAPGSKYQCGPLGTGIVYIRDRALPSNPAPPSPFWPVVSLAYPLDGGLPPRDGVTATGIAGLVQRSDSADLSRSAALGEAVRLWEWIGRDRIRAHANALAERIAARIAERWGRDALYSPLTDDRLRSPMVSVRPFRDPALMSDPSLFGRLATLLRDEHDVGVGLAGFPVRGKGVPEFAIRLSPHIYTTADEADYAVDALIAATSDL